MESCTNSGYFFAGLQYGSQCICSDDVPHGGAIKNETRCDYRCPGDESATCGGEWMMNLYQATNTITTTITTIENTGD